MSPFDRYYELFMQLFHESNVTCNFIVVDT